jgi:hypothetical protein
MVPLLPAGNDLLRGGSYKELLEIRSSMKSLGAGGAWGAYLALSASHALASL